MTAVLSHARSLAWHEAHHAAALLMAGIAPKCVRVDWPDNGLAGSVEFDWDAHALNRATAGDVLRAVIVGGQTEGGLDAWRQWPLQSARVPGAARRDAEVAMTLAKYIGVDSAAEWLLHIRRAGQLTHRRDFRLLAVAITNALEDVESLDGRALRRLMAVIPTEEPVCAT
jgi:hypothetical protein